LTNFASIGEFLVKLAQQFGDKLDEEPAAIEQGKIKQIKGEDARDYISRFKAIAE
jgi:hypothetical protein